MAKKRAFPVKGRKPKPIKRVGRKHDMDKEKGSKPFRIEFRCTFEEVAKYRKVLMPDETLSAMIRQALETEVASRNA